MGSFKDVVGHKDIINYIRSAVTENKVSHAYILNGERGSGKKMLASLFATTLLCEKQGPDLQRMPFLPAGGEREPSGYHPGDPREAEHHQRGGHTQAGQRGYPDQALPGAL